MAFQFPANPTLGQQFAPATGTTYEWNGTGWIFLGINTASLYPAGIVLPYAGTAPLPFQGWLICDGASYTTAAQPTLFAVIGYAYGGSGGNFNVPDLRGRVLAGVDAGAGRLTSGTLGAGLGAQSVTLTTAQTPSHAHGITDVAHAHTINDTPHGHAVYDPGHSHGHTLNDPWHTHGYDRVYAIGNEKQSGQSQPAPFDAYQTSPYALTHGAPTGITLSINAAGTSIGIYGGASGITGTVPNNTGLSTTNAAGGGQAHTNVQPTLCLNYIIKA